MNQGANRLSNQATHHGVDHYENFPVASVLCPPHLRAPITAIYWFARTADDIADEGDASAETRLGELATLRIDLTAASNGNPDSLRWRTIFEKLSLAIAQYSLPVQLLDDLLTAFEQDVVKQRYSDTAELLDYCRRSANPVGRLLLHLYGIKNEQALEMSDAICSALQLINFWQDLSLDIPRGRIYLPVDSWARHGVTEKQLLSLQNTFETTRLVTENVRSARNLMLSGFPLVKIIPGRGGWELRFVVQGGLRILDKIEALNFNTLQYRPKLGKWDVLVMGWRALWM